MSDTVFILGAGASKHAGAPLMANFLDVANELYFSGKTGKQKEHFERVFNAIGLLQSVHSKAQLDLTNIESIFNAFELGRIIQRIPGIEVEEIEELVTSLKELIVTTIELTMHFPCEGSFICPHPSYEQFANLISKMRSDLQPKHSVSVISFNYDVGVDLALVRANLVPNYALDGNLGGKPQDIDLLKLHGSINWASESGSGSVRSLNLRDYLSKWRGSGFSETVQLPIGKQLQEHFKRFENGTVVNAEPVIVPPSWNKGTYHQNLKKVWARAASHLSGAKNIFVLGYSLPETDAFFRLLYALGSVGDQPLQRIFVFNPDDSGLVDNRFRSLLGPGAELRYQYRNVTFEKAVEELEEIFFRKSGVGVWV